MLSTFHGQEQVESLRPTERQSTYGACGLLDISLDGLLGSHHDAKTEAFALVNPHPSMVQDVAASGCQPPFECGTLRGPMTLSDFQGTNRSTTPMVG